MRYYRHGAEITEDEALDMRGVVKDGVTLRVPVSMRDSAPPPVAHARVTDADGGTAGLHRPGYRIADADDERQQAYDAYRHDLENAWRQPLHDARRKKTLARDPFGREAGTFEEQEEDDEQCHRRRRDNWADGMTVDQVEAQHRRNMANVYAEYDQTLRDSWRKP